MNYLNKTCFEKDPALGFFPHQTSRVHKKLENSNKISIKSVVIGLCLGVLIGLLGMPLASANIEESPPAFPLAEGAEHLDYDNTAENSAEIRLAHAENLDCRKRHGHPICDGHDPEVILVHQPYYVPVPVYPAYGNICRNGYLSCYTPVLPLGGPCTCWTAFGLFWFTGYITSW